MSVRVRLSSFATEEVMAEEEKGAVPAPFLLAFAPIRRSALGVAVGVVLGGLVFLMTAVLLVRDGNPIGLNLALLGQYFLGYTVTWPGAVLGLLWGLVLGFVLGWGFALIRNLAVWLWLTVIRSRAEMEHYADFLDHL
jgi:hypothetical protein